MSKPASQSGNQRSATVPVVAALVFALLVVPIATAGDSGEPAAKARVSIERQIKKLKKQVRKLKRQVKGPAGGDLAGNYPNPTIAAGAVSSAKVEDGSLTGDDLANGSLTGDDLANGSVSGDDVADGSLGGADLASDSVTGLDIDESSLGQVPGATHAEDADRATFLSNGSLVGAEIISYVSDITDGESPLFSAGGVAVSASCPAGNLVVEVTSTGDNASITSAATNADAGPTLVNPVYDGDFDAGEDENLVAADQTHVIGHTEFVGSGGGPVVTINWAADEGTLDFCVFTGTVVYGTV